MGIFESVAGIFQAIAQIVPKPLKYIFFMIILAFALDVTVTLVLSSFVTCCGTTAYTFDSIKARTQFEGAKTQAELCKIGEVSDSINVTIGGVKGSSVVGFVERFYNLMWSIARMYGSFGDSLTGIYFNFKGAVSSPCIVAEEHIDENTNEKVYNLINVSGKNCIDLAREFNARKTIDRLDKKREILAIGCDNGVPSILLGEKINILSYKLWLILILICTFGWYVYDKTNTL